MTTAITMPTTRPIPEAPAIRPPSHQQPGAGSSIAALAAQARILLGFGIGRAEVEFLGGGGSGTIPCIELFPAGEDTRPIHPEIRALLLGEEAECPGSHPVTIGALLEHHARNLLHLRHPRWTQHPGARGEITLTWSHEPGTPALAVGGVIQSMEPNAPEQPFWTGHHGDGESMESGKGAA